MHRVTISCTSVEFLQHLEWAQNSGLAPTWMGMSVPDAIETVRIEAEMEPNIGMPYHLEVEDPEDIMLFLLKGWKTEKDSILHRLPFEGISIYERLHEIIAGQVSNTCPKYNHSWECWLEGDQKAMSKTETLEEFQDLYFGRAGLVNREIALLQRLVHEGYHAQGINADRVVQRWGSAEAGIAALREVLDHAN